MGYQLEKTGSGAFTIRDPKGKAVSYNLEGVIQGLGAKEVEKKLKSYEGKDVIGYLEKLVEEVNEFGDDFEEKNGGFPTGKIYEISGSTRREVKIDSNLELELEHDGYKFYKNKKTGYRTAFSPKGEIIVENNRSGFIIEENFPDIIAFNYLEGNRGFGRGLSFNMIDTRTRYVMKDGKILNKEDMKKNLKSRIKKIALDYFNVEKISQIPSINETEGDFKDGGLSFAYHSKQKTFEKKIRDYCDFCIKEYKKAKKQ